VAPATHALVTAATIFAAVPPQGAYLCHRQVQWSLDRSYSTSSLRHFGPPFGRRSHPPMRVLDILIDRAHRLSGRHIFLTAEAPEDLFQAARAVVPLFPPASLDTCSRPVTRAVVEPTSSGAD
jgi:hypothetical protein